MYNRKSLCLRLLFKYVNFNTMLQADSLKPTLDRIIGNIVESLSGEHKEFYEKEFTFFENVTSISGKLKPYIKRPKPEKKV